MNRRCVWSHIQLVSFSCNCAVLVYCAPLCRICICFFLLLETVAFSCIHRSVGLLIRTSFRCARSVLRLPNTNKSNGTKFQLYTELRVRGVEASKVY